MLNNAKPCAGVYRITAPSGNCYIGSSVNMRVRVRAHKYQLKAGIHTNKVLQAAYDKYNGELIAVSICECSSDTKSLAVVEQRFIDELNPEYNLARFIGRPVRYPDTNHKISVALKGRPKSEETKRKLREAARNRGPVSVETRKKQSETRRGRKFTEEHKQKLALASTGRRHSAETKAKLSAMRLNGRLPRPPSPGVGRGKGSPGVPRGPRGPWPQWVRDKIGQAHRRRAAEQRAMKENSPC